MKLSEGVRHEAVGLALLVIAALTIPAIFYAAKSLAESMPEIKIEDGQVLIEDKAYFLGDAKWPHNSIYVCWENYYEIDPADIAIAVEAVSSTWQKHSSLNFHFNEECHEESAGLRVLVDDDELNAPHTKGLGRHLDGVRAGVVLNFSFNNWRRKCKLNKASCIRSVTVHEFGHAIGFSHEQNRPDTAGECALFSNGPNGDTYLLTPWDPDSVMNYCNERFNNGGELSPLDITALKIAYPTE